MRESTRNQKNYQLKFVGEIKKPGAFVSLASGIDIELQALNGSDKLATKITY